jgi:hypothetical protein
VHEIVSKFRPVCTFIEGRFWMTNDKANLDLLYDGCWGIRRMSQHTPAEFSIESSTTEMKSGHEYHKPNGNFISDCHLSEMDCLPIHGFVLSEC